MRYQLRQLIFGILLLASGTVAAILPPFYSSVDEITSILHDKEISNKIGSGRVIQSLQRVNSEKGVAWEIVVGPQGECRLLATLVYQKPPVNDKGEMMVGPAHFTVQAGSLVCQNDSNTNPEEKKPEDHD